MVVSIRLKVSVLIYSSAWVFLTVAHFACEIYSVLAVQKVLLTNCQLDLCLVETHWAKGENKAGGGGEYVKYLKALLSCIAVQSRFDQCRIILFISSRILIDDCGNSANSKGRSRTVNYIYENWI